MGWMAQETMTKSDIEQEPAPGTIEYVRLIIADIDPNANPDSDDFQGMVAVFSMLLVGAKPEALSDFTGIPLGKCREYVQNLNRAGQVEGGLLTDDWIEPEFDEIGFFLSVACAMGQVEVQRAKTAYVHPDESSLRWSGRGRRPHWLNELIASGVDLDDLKRVLT